MGNSPGDDKNNDGLNDTTGKNIFGGTNKKMTEEESAAFDKELMDLLDDEAEEKGMFSDDAQASNDRFSGDYEDDVFADDEFADMSGGKSSGGWKSGDKVPSPGVYNHYNGTYTVDGKVVTKEEFDANQKAREDFLNVASDNTNKNYKDAYAEEMLRSDGKNPGDEGYEEDYNTYKNQAEDYYQDNQVTNAKLNEVMNNPTYQKLDYSTQENIKAGLASNNKQMQMDLSLIHI